MVIQMPVQQIFKKGKNPYSKVSYQELAVPAFSFGGAILALFFSGTGNTLDVRYFALGCVISSFVLAYLAWIRPRKDIVAMTTPIYSIIFFVAPSEIEVNLILELLYATSLTILLVRLKYRFGPAPQSGIAKGNDLDEPLMGYCTSVSGHLSGVNPTVGHLAAVGFIRFAQGDYREVIPVADTALVELPREVSLSSLVTAFKIIREQARLLDESADQPEQFIEFSASDAGLLAKSLPRSDRLNDHFDVSLDNALLLLFAAAWAASEKDHPTLRIGQGFALKLFAP